jgi:two-component sensor histidine kinase
LQQPEIRSSMPLFRLNRIMVNNKLVVNAKPVILSHTQNNIELNYSILSFKTDFKFPLYYKINENDWKLTSPESRQLLLTALSPGKYTIAFRLGKTGTVMEPEDVVHFEITKPWWQTWWALVIFVSCFFCLFLIVYKWQTGILKKQNSLLQQKFELEKELRHSTLKSIKAQMNPHFFYNALNTIQNFIFSDDKRSASTYLSKFSKLTRTILEMSEKDTVGLIEELEALQLYLDIEKVRFTEDFNFSLIVPENINPEMIKIPSMLIQPYVENAIKHGLLHKKGAKELVVEFHLKDNFLYVRVDDNGIGRKRSAEINRIKNSKYESFATKANSKRLDILNKGDTKVGIEYTDKTDGMGNSLGTKVVIRIPVA